MREEKYKGFCKARQITENHMKQTQMTDYQNSANEQKLHLITLTKFTMLCLLKKKTMTTFEHLYTILKLHNVT